MKESYQHPEYLTVPDAAKFSGVSRNTLYMWVKSGKLSAYQTPGRTNFIRPSDLVDFMRTSGMFVPSGLSVLAKKDEELDGPVIVDESSDDNATEAILVVDDEPSSRNLLVRTVNPLSKIYQAETGYEALHLLTLHSEINITLLDLRMPGLHGLATLAEINRCRPEVRIVVVTGFVDDIPSELLRDGGSIAGVIEKPFSISALQQTVKDLQESFSSSRSAATTL
ncbi:MAG: response regulator [Kiritimatiellae bacterium]|nr:response regulator [Kiritimatiellia bacterium]